MTRDGQGSADRSTVGPERAEPGLGDGDGPRRGDAYRRRWWTLVVLSVSLLVIIIDDTIINVAVPTLQRQLGASATGLQWIVDGPASPASASPLAPSSAGGSSTTSGGGRCSC